MKSSNIVYSEHGVDECFEYKNGSGRVPDGLAVGFVKDFSEGILKYLFLFDDIIYSNYDHDYWDNLELENDVDRLILP
jgi:hypothetical protein